MHVGKNGLRIKLTGIHRGWVCTKEDVEEEEEEEEEKSRESASSLRERRRRDVQS